MVDLNPLSRSAKMATVTIVDEVSRAFDGILHSLLNDLDNKPTDWDNGESLKQSMKEIADHITE